MRKYPKIPRFDEFLQNVRNHLTYNPGPEPYHQPLESLPQEKRIVTLQGSVKLHGTNAGIAVKKDGSFIIQSREREISIENDNAGFAAFVMVPERQQFLQHTLTKLLNLMQLDEIVLFGEFAGAKVQGGVAVSQVEKFFAPFDVIGYVNDVPTSFPFAELFENEELRIFPIEPFKIEFDVTNPQPFVDFVNEMVEQCEKQCPFAKGMFGLDGVGEGYVFTVTLDHNTYKFKAKGEKHSAKKQKKPVEIDPLIATKINELMDIVCTEVRLNQGIDKLKEFGLEFKMKNIGTFIEWISKDILEEECKMIEASGIEYKKIKSKITQLSREFYIKKLNQI